MTSIEQHCSYGCGMPANRLGPPVVWQTGSGRELRFCCHLHESYWREENPDVKLYPRDGASTDCPDHKEADGGH